MLEVPTDVIPADHYVEVYGTNVYKEAANAHYDVMNNCINECAENVNCHMATWYTTGTFGSTGKKCKFMHTSSFQNIPNVTKVDNKVYVPIDLTKKNNVVRHFGKPASVHARRPYVHTDSSGKKFVVFEGTTLNAII